MNLSQEDFNNQINQITEGAPAHIEKYIKAYNKRNKTRVVLFWSVNDIEGKKRVLVEYKEKGRGRRIETTNVYNLPSFIFETFQHPATVRIFFNMGIKKAGGEAAVKEAIRQTVESNLISYLEQRKGIIAMSVRGDALQIELLNINDFSNIGKVSFAEIAEIMKVHPLVEPEEEPEPEEEKKKTIENEQLKIHTEEE